MTEIVARLLAEAPQRIEILAPGTIRIGGRPEARSYLADGRLVVWRPTSSVSGLAFAVDAELSAQPVPPALARRLDCTEPALFWPQWTRLEVNAKLYGVPIHTLLARHGLGSPDELPIRVFTHDSVTVAVSVLDQRQGPLRCYQPTLLPSRTCLK